ncbi:hypothetical protein AVEN_203603-1, partial [Araneus ventricosus]
CDKTPNSSEPGIEPVSIQLEHKHTNPYTGRDNARWDRWFIKSFPTSILREMVSGTVSAEMLSQTCRSNLVIESFPT